MGEPRSDAKGSIFVIPGSNEPRPRSRDPPPASRRGHPRRYGFRGERVAEGPRLDAMPAPGQIAIAVAIVVAVLLSLRILVAVPGWVRHVRRPEARAIRVVGVGGGGNNAVDRMVGAGIDGVSFVGFNTDAQALRGSRAGLKVRIGDKTTGGLGAGGDPDLGRAAAEEDAEWIGKAVAGADLVFVTAGLGGGTGSGAAPIVAGIARDQGALTIGVVTKPFEFEGSQRARVADAAAAELGGKVDALIVVPNDRVGDVLASEASVIDAFGAVDDVLLRAVEGIIDLIDAPGLINLDFADVRSVMKDAGPALIGLGRGSGEHRAIEAARQAVASPLLEARFEGARGILFNVSGPEDLRLGEVRAAAEEIRKHADRDANIIFGASFSEALGDDVLVTLMATGLDGHDHADERPEPEPARKRPGRAVKQAAPEPAVASEPEPAAPTEPSPAAPASDDDDFEVPSFLRRARRPSRSAPTPSADAQPEQPEPAPNGSR
jgi:cell division protein FtsZ